MHFGDGNSVEMFNIKQWKSPGKCKEIIQLILGIKAKERTDINRYSAEC